MREPYHRSTVGVGNLKTCFACAETIPESANRCRYCQTDQTPWRRTSSWAVPVLSLVVAILALLPDIVPPVVQSLAQPRANVILRSAGVEGENLHLLFENAGTERGIVGNELACSMTLHTPDGSPAEVELGRPMPNLRIQNTLEQIIDLDTPTGVTFQGKIFIVVQEGSEARLVPYPSLSETHAWLRQHLRETAPETVEIEAFRLGCRLEARTLLDGAAGATEQHHPEIMITLVFGPGGMIERDGVATADL